MFVVHDVERSPFHTFDCFVAAGQGRTVASTVRVFRGTASGIPHGVAGIILASDLQAVALGPRDHVRRLVGEVLCDHLELLALQAAIPPLAELGVVLAGDLYSAPQADVRGASGDVRAVWRAFAARFRWVVGVAGNHDTFGTKLEEEALRSEQRVHLLDGDDVVLDGLRIAGVGKIIGDARKPGRRGERDFLRAIRTVLARRPEILVMHHGPDADRGALRGHPSIRAALDRRPELFVVCGHVYWPEPVTRIRGGAQVMNVDGRVVVLMRN
jgi:3',5'-cyclic-AMP phosphodiesterase